MSTSTTRTASFTITDARYVGAKLGADLRVLHDLYGRPSLDHIDDYCEEVALLLRDGYLGTVDYGFKNSGDNSWRLRLRYTATTSGQLDSRPGRLPTAIDISGSSFYSYLTYSTAFQQLTSDQRQSIKQALPIARGSATEPTASAGASEGGQGYARHGTGVTRDVYTAY